MSNLWEINFLAFWLTQGAGTYWSRYEVQLPTDTHFLNEIFLSPHYFDP